MFIIVTDRSLFSQSRKCKDDTKEFPETGNEHIIKTLSDFSLTFLQNMNYDEMLLMSWKSNDGDGEVSQDRKQSRNLDVMWLL